MSQKPFMRDSAAVIQFPVDRTALRLDCGQIPYDVTLSASAAQVRRDVVVPFRRMTTK